MELLNVYTLKKKHNNTYFNFKNKKHMDGYANKSLNNQNVSNS